MNGETENDFRRAVMGEQMGRRVARTGDRGGRGREVKERIGEGYLEAKSGGLFQL